MPHLFTRPEADAIETALFGSSSDFDGALLTNAVHSNPVAREYAAARARKQQTERRLRGLQGLFDDPASFDAVVAKGRYLKLCALLGWASDNDEVAAERLRLASENHAHCLS